MTNADDFFTDFTKRFPSALCAQTDPEIFFPEKGGSTVAAKKVCMRCPERVDCLEDALETRERFGVRGGLSERERHVILKARDRAQASA
jgi:WhiB family redox-sensing transcriptional regulator